MIRIVIDRELYGYKTEWNWQVVIGTNFLVVEILESEFDADQYSNMLRQAMRNRKSMAMFKVRKIDAMFFDMDATIIAEETIVELAREIGRADEVSKVTEQAMRGELDFGSALHRRVSTLSGASAEIFESVSKRLTPNPGVFDLLAMAKILSVPCFLVSGGFLQIINLLDDRYTFSEVHANKLGVVRGCLDGTIVGSIVDANAKCEFLKDRCLMHGYNMRNVVAVGDGANDIPMLASAGVSFGFDAKEVLWPKLDGWIDHYHALMALLWGRSPRNIRHRYG